MPEPSRSILRERCADVLANQKFASVIEDLESMSDVYGDGEGAAAAIWAACEIVGLNSGGTPKQRQAIKAVLKKLSTTPQPSGKGTVKKSNKIPQPSEPAATGTEQDLINSWLRGSDSRTLFDGLCKEVTHTQNTTLDETLTRILICVIWLEVRFCENYALANAVEDIKGHTWYSEDVQEVLSGGILTFLPTIVSNLEKLRDNADTIKDPTMDESRWKAFLDLLAQRPQQSN